MAFVDHPRDLILSRVTEAFGAGYAYPSWQVFRGQAAAVRSACEALKSKICLPRGARLESFRHPDTDVIDQVQALNAASGVAPYPAWYSRGDVVGCVTTCLWDESGTLIASASVADKFHAKGRLAGYVFKGSTCVAPDQRGGGLGKIVNADALLTSLETFGWQNVMSQVQVSNLASQNTIGACGLAAVPDRITLGILPKGAVFTR